MTPAPALPRPEKQVQADVVRALRNMGFNVSSTSQARASKVTRGIPDLYASHSAWRLRFWLEIKRPGGKVSAHQAAWHAAERAAGGTVLVAQSVGDVVLELGRMGAPIS